MNVMDADPFSGSLLKPLATEPRHLLVVLNLARRKAFYTLLQDITEHMHARLELPENPFQRKDPNGPDPLLAERPSSSSTMATNMTGATVVPLPVSQELLRLRLAAQDDMKAWSEALLAKLKELLSANDDNTIIEARRKRLEKLALAAHPTSLDLLGLDPFSSEHDIESAVMKLQNLYRPSPTRLTTISPRDKEEVLSALLLQVLSDGSYSAHDRVLLCHVASSLGLPIAVLAREEAAVADTLISSQAKMGPDAQAQQKRKQEGQAGRYWKVGLASVAGAAVIGITGGLAAPVVAGAIGGIMGGIGLGGVASFLGIFWMNSALVGTLFGAYGALMGGEMMDAYAKEVEDFAFLPLRKPKKGEKTNPRLRLTVGVNGLLTSKDDITAPWAPIPGDSEVHALRYEPHSLLALGEALKSLVSTTAWRLVKGEVLRRTVLSSITAALWPPYLVATAASQLDNPFSRAKNRSDKAGRVLADALEARVQGKRPVTLVGFSLGARVVAICLKTLAERRVFGVVEDVVLVGAPVPSDSAYWANMRSVISGRIVNVFSSNDFVLGFLYRAASVQLGVAGLQAVEGVAGVENLDLSDEVDGHLRYPASMGKILARCGFEGIAGGNGKIDGKDAVVVGDEGDLLNLEDDNGEGDWGWKDDEVDQRVGNLEGLRIGGENKSQSKDLLDDFDDWPEATPELPQRPGMAGPSVSAPAVTTSPNAHGSSSLDLQGLSFSPEALTAKKNNVGDTEEVEEGLDGIRMKPKLPERPGVPPKAATFPSTPYFTEEGRGEIDSDEEHGGIQMEDNDHENNGELLEYVEPIPVEDPHGY